MPRRRETGSSPTKTPGSSVYRSRKACSGVQSRSRTPSNDRVEGIAMRRNKLFFILLPIVFLGIPRGLFAQGGGKGWIERLSGPGPWKGVDLFGPVGCFTKNDEGRN